jgi:putative SOS response-associated peptidase YedK
VIAGIWPEDKGDAPSAFTKLTTEPGQDIGLYHDRQVVILQPRDWANWIYLTKSEAELLQPLRAGLLAVETARAGSD